VQPGPLAPPAMMEQQVQLDLLDLSDRLERLDPQDRLALLELKAQLDLQGPRALPE